MGQENQTSIKIVYCDKQDCRYYSRVLLRKKAICTNQRKNGSQTNECNLYESNLTRQESIIQ